jgi:hypothetical protein
MGEKWTDFSLQIDYNKIIKIIKEGEREQ